jgi:hypothetical protein
MKRPGGFKERMKVQALLIMGIIAPFNRNDHMQ